MKQSEEQPLRIQTNQRRTDNSQSSIQLQNSLYQNSQRMQFKLIILILVICIGLVSFSIYSYLNLQVLEGKTVNLQQNLTIQVQTNQQKLFNLSQQVQQQKDINLEGIQRQIYLKEKLQNVSKLFQEGQKRIAELIKQGKSGQEKIVELEKRIKSGQQRTTELSKQIKSNQEKIEKLSNQLKNVEERVKNNSIAIAEIIHYDPLPSNLLKQSSDNKSLAEILYKDEQIRKKRLQFINERIQYVHKNPGWQSMYLIKYNYVTNEQMIRLRTQENLAEWARLQKKFNLSTVKEELPICIIVPSYNNNAKFRIQANLNSIFTQNYTNYKVVIINDASTDGSGELYKNYLSFFNIDKNRYVYIENAKKQTALQNIYENTLKHCSKESIGMILDGDDQFIGQNVLNLFNWGFQTKKAGVIYTNFIYYQQNQTLRQGFTSQYSDDQKQNNLYRDVVMKFSQQRAFRVQLFHQINPKDLKDEKGDFFTIAYDMALFFPLMQLSCGRVHKIEGQFTYLYNMGTGANDYLDEKRQLEIDSRVRKQQKYSCLKSFEQKMKK